MARPRNFDDETILFRLLDAFWRLGHTACTIADLETATGLKRQSLYNLHGDKDGLFLAALGQYRALVRQSLAPLCAPDADGATIRRFFRSTLATLSDGDFGGCLIVRTAMGPAHADPRVGAEILAASIEVRAALVAAIITARARGTLAAGQDADALAAALFALLHGLSALARTGGTPESIDFALDGLLPGATPRATA